MEPIGETTCVPIHWCGTCVEPIRGNGSNLAQVILMPGVSRVLLYFLPLPTAIATANAGPTATPTAAPIPTIAPTPTPTCAARLLHKPIAGPAILIRLVLHPNPNTYPSAHPNPDTWLWLWLWSTITYHYASEPSSGSGSGR